MKITNVSTAVIAGNFPWVLVKVETDSGVSGLGEAYWGAGVAELVHKAKPLLIEKQAARIIAPDIPKMGGLAEAKKVADHADMYYIPIAPHNVASPIGTVAGAHVCAAMNNFLVMEFHAQDVPWWDALVVGGPTIVDGFIHLDDRPGHGLTLNEDVARAHLKPGSSFFGDTP